VGRGLAASGGCPPLFQLGVFGLRHNVVTITHEPSLTLPSVRRLEIEMDGTDVKAALLLCCGLVRVGYRHRFETNLRAKAGALSVADDACLRLMLSLQGTNFVST
jgi:hypothetical protein